MNCLHPEALRGMEAVAEHINEMQKIYEEYGLIFDDLLRAFKDERRKVASIAAWLLNKTRACLLAESGKIRLPIE